MAIEFFAFFFSDNRYFRMILVSMADIIGSYERLPNDAVRAVAVAKRREYEQWMKVIKVIWTPVSATQVSYPVGTVLVGHYVRRRFASITQI